MFTICCSNTRDRTWDSPLNRRALPLSYVGMAAGEGLEPPITWLTATRLAYFAYPAKKRSVLLRADASPETSLGRLASFFLNSHEGSSL